MALVAAAIAVLTALGIAGEEVRLRAQLRSAAELAAVQAADARRGLIDGNACDRAQRVAELNGVVVSRCEPTDAGMLVVLEGRSSWGPFSSTAHAGRPTSR